MQQQRERLSVGLSGEQPEMNDLRQITLSQPVEIRRLLPLETDPPLAERGQRRHNLGLAKDVAVHGRRRRHATPARQPQKIDAVEVQEHALERRLAELLADLARDGLLSEPGRHVEQRPIGPPVVGVQRPDRLETHPQSSSATVSPSCTVCPSRTRISFTAPARGASTGISIFIDSSTITGSPAATLSPTLAVTWNTTPVMCALISSAMERSLFDHLS